MAEFVKYADGRGADSLAGSFACGIGKGVARALFSQQGFLIYSIKPRTDGGGCVSG